jgi:plasmid stabilization system protein ParE
MGSKKTVRKTGSGARRSVNTTRALARSAQAELARLLKRNEAGTVTRVQLHTGLKEVNQQLKVLRIHIHMPS